MASRLTRAGAATAVAVALAVLLSVLGPHPRSVVHAEGAVHAGDCFINQPTTLNLILDFCYTEVQTPSGNANQVLHGHLSNPTTAPAKAVQFQGFLCGTSYGVTTDTHAVLTPDGQLNGTCKFH